MVSARWGRIVNLSSVSALGNRGQANYSAAKAGMQGFTKTLAIELGPFGVTANAIAPGFIVTDMTRSHRRADGGVVRRVPGGRRGGDGGRRVGVPEDIAGTISSSSPKMPPSSRARSSTSPADPRTRRGHAHLREHR